MKLPTDGKCDSKFLDCTFYSQRCTAAVSSIESRDDICRAKIDYHLCKVPKSRSYIVDHLYTFPIVNPKKHLCFSHSLDLAEVACGDYFTAPIKYKLIIDVNTMSLDPHDVEVREYNESEKNKGDVILYNTRDLIYSRPIHEQFSNVQGNVFALRTRTNSHPEGFIHYFSIDYLDTDIVCKQINNLIENAHDSFIISQISDCEFTIDYKALKLHVNVLNTIIKELIDTAIIVARSVEYKKKFEKSPKSTSCKKSKGLSMKMMADSPTSDEFVTILEKVRVGINCMARLNPFVSNPNVPELLHHMIAPFSLITSVCGLDIVKNVSKPYISKRAIFLIENCFTTNELAFWRTLGDNWNKPRCSYDPCEVFEDYLKSDPEALFSIGCQPESVDNDSVNILYGDCMGIVLEYNRPTMKQQIYLNCGEYVQIIGKEGENYIVQDVKEKEGLVPKNKIYTFKNILWKNHLLFDSCYHKICSRIRYYKRSPTESIHSSLKSKSNQSSFSKSSNTSQKSISQHETEVENKQEEFYSKSFNHTAKTSHLSGLSTSVTVDPSTSKATTSGINTTCKTKSDSFSKNSETQLQTEINSSSFLSSKSCSSKSNQSKSSHFSKKTEIKKKNSCWCCIRKPNIKKDVVKELESCKSCSSESLTSKKSLKSSQSSHSSTSTSSVKKASQNCSTKVPIIDSSSSCSSPSHETTNHTIQSNSQEECIKPQIVKNFDDESLQKGISLCWSKTQSPQEDCIKIEGIKLFRVRIKLLPCEDESDNGTNLSGKATLLLKSHDDISLKPNTKLVLKNKDKITTKSINLKKENFSSLSKKGESVCKLKRIVCSTDSSSLSVKEKSKKLTKPSSSICSDQGLPICCEDHNNKSLSKTDSLKRAPVSFSPSRVTYEENENDEITQEVWCQEESNVEGMKNESCMNTKEVYRILKKYIPAENIPETTQTETKGKVKVSQESLVDFCKNNICKKCGGICPFEQVYIPDENKVYYQQVCHSYNQKTLNEETPQPCIVSDESSKQIYTPSRSSTSYEEKKSSKLSIPSFNEYCAPNSISSDKSSKKSQKVVSPCDMSFSSEHSDNSYKIKNFKSPKSETELLSNSIPSNESNDKSLSTDISKEVNAPKPVSETIEKSIETETSTPASTKPAETNVTNETNETPKVETVSAVEKTLTPLTATVSSTVVELTSASAVETTSLPESGSASASSPRASTVETISLPESGFASASSPGETSKPVENNSSSSNLEETPKLVSETIVDSAPAVSKPLMDSTITTVESGVTSLSLNSSNTTTSASTTEEKPKPIASETPVVTASFETAVSSNPVTESLVSNPLHIDNSHSTSLTLNTSTESTENVGNTTSIIMANETTIPTTMTH